MSGTDRVASPRSQRAGLHSGMRSQPGFLILTLLVACLRGGRDSDSDGDTGAIGDTDSVSDTADSGSDSDSAGSDSDSDSGSVDLSAMRARVASSLDCGTPPTMTLDQTAFLSVLDRPQWFATRWLLIDLYIQNVADIFAGMFPEQAAACLTFTEPDYSGFSGSCADVEGWTVSGSMSKWAEGGSDGGTWTDLVIVEPWPYSEWQISGTGHWQADFIGTDTEAYRYDIDRQWTNIGAQGGAADNGTFRIVASGDYGTADGVFAGYFSSLDDAQSWESEAPRAPLPDGSTCFARAAVNLDGSWFGWDAVMGDHLWELETTVDARGAACTRVYTDGALIDDGCTG